MLNHNQGIWWGCFQYANTGRPFQTNAGMQIHTRKLSRGNVSLVMWCANRNCICTSIHELDLQRRLTKPNQWNRIYASLVPTYWCIWPFRSFRPLRRFVSLRRPCDLNPRDTNYYLNHCSVWHPSLQLDCINKGWHWLHSWNCASVCFVSPRWLLIFFICLHTCIKLIQL